MNKDKLGTRGRTFVGKIKSAKMKRTAVFELERKEFLPKYERYQKRRTKIKVHNPESIGAKEGDIVRIQETRPLSKTKKFTIIEVMKE